MKNIIFKIIILIMISIIISCSNENSGTKKENIQLSENERLEIFDIRYLTSENGEYLNILLKENSKSVFVDYIFYENQSINALIFDTEINEGYIKSEAIDDYGTNYIEGNLSDAGFNGKIEGREVNFVSAKSPLSGAKVVRYTYTNISPTSASEEDKKIFEYYSSIFLFNNDKKSAIIDKINLDINSEITSEKLDINKLSDIKNILSNNMLPFYNDWAGKGEYGYNYYSVSEYGIDYLSEKIVSINKYFYEYKGGAHGVHEKIYKVYSLSNGERLKIEDIFIDVNNLDLINKVKEKLLSMFDKEIYFNFLDELSLQENNFYITSKGLTFTWGIYEIAPYAMGDFEVLFSIDEIMPYLKDEYKSIFE